jgi:drug/metabolite transporter (DMT)-like permease
MFNLKKGGGTMFAIALVSMCIVLGAAGQLFMKRGMGEIGEVGSVGELFHPSTLWQMLTNPFVFGGVVMYAVALILWLGALSQLEVSMIYPLLSLGYVLTALFAFAFLHEVVTLARWVGILLITLGCYLILLRV